MFRSFLACSSTLQGLAITHAPMTNGAATKNIIFLIFEISVIGGCSGHLPCL